MYQIRPWLRGGVPDPAGAGYSAPQTPAGFQGASALETFVIIALCKLHLPYHTIPYHTSKGKEGRKDGKEGQGMDEKAGRGPISKARGRQGKGGVASWRRQSSPNSRCMLPVVLL